MNTTNKRPGVILREASFLREKSKDDVSKNNTNPNHTKDETSFFKKLQKRNKDPPIKYWEPHEIKIKLYLKECEKLKVIPVSAYIRQPSKTVLKLKHYNIGPRGAKALAAALLLDTVIAYLDIEGNSITSYGLASIKESLTENVHITYLNIADNNLGSRGAQLIGMMMLHNHSIETLDASKNGFRDCDAGEFSKILRENRILKELILAGNEFEEQAGTEFGSALAFNDTLERLDLSWNHIRKKGAADFANGIKENVCLKKLDLSFNGLGTEGSVCMGQALATNRTLLELDMSKNRLTNFDMQVFTKQMAQNDTLQVLRLKDNLINALAAMELLRSIMSLETSSLQVLDFGTMCVDQCFLIVLKELQEMKDVEVIHGRIQNVYLDRDMMPQTANPEQDLADFDDGVTPGISEADKTEKGKTYIVDGEPGKGPDNADNENEPKEGQNEPKGEQSEQEPGQEGESVVDFDEKKLDDEVEAVTGKPQVEDQKALADDKGSAGTLTPDI